MPNGDEFKGGYWTDGDIEYLRNTLRFTDDQIRQLMEKYPDGAASAGISIPNNTRRGQDYAGGLYGNPIKPGFTWVPGQGWVPNNTDPRNNPPPGTTGDYTPNFLDPTKFFDPTFINQRFDVGRGNTARAQGSAVAGAQRSAGAIAGAQGLLNAAGFITGAGSQARQPYASVFGQLEEGRASALNQNQGALYNALFNKQALEEDARRFGITTEQQKYQFERNYQLQLQQLQNQQRQQESNWGDWIAGLLPAAASLINPFLGMATGAVTLPSGTWGNRPSSIKSYTPPPLTSYNPYQTLGRR